MRAGIGMRFTAVLVGAFLLAGCASQPVFTPQEWLGTEILSAREQPARASTHSDQELQQQGYVRIGSIDHEVVLDTRWGSEVAGPAPTTGPDVTAGVLRKAAEHGGDVVQFGQDNVIAGRRVEKSVETAWRTETTTELYQRSLGSGLGSVQDTRVVTRSVPTAWRTESGWQHFIRSSGSVWRRDETLPPRIAAWEQARAEQLRARAAGWQSAAPRLVASDEFGQLRSRWEKSIPDVTRARAITTPVPFPKKFENGRYGYLDGYAVGNTIIEPRFSDARHFRGGLAAAAVGDGPAKRWGFLAKDGSWAIPPDYLDVRDFHQGLAPVRAQNGKWGFLDEAGKLLIPAFFDSSTVMHDDMAKVVIDGREGYILRDHDGEVWVSP